MPDFAEVKARWQPSEAWLYDRGGVLLDSERVNFAARRGAWVPLERIAAPVPAAIIASEDRRFSSHDGVDWLAVAAAAQARLTGESSRGASTITMQLAAFLAPELAQPGQRG
jgi:penicillin-binding protein 1C